MRKHYPFHILPSVAILAILGFAIWWMADTVVWLGDDLDYKFRMKGAIWQSWGWIKSWEEYWLSQFTHYMNVNGRFVAHAFVQLFNGILGQQAFAICNAMVYVGFALAVAKTGDVRLRSNFGGVFTAVCLSVICFVTKMMPTCQIGYIWGMLANLMWLSAFYSKGRKTWGAVLLLFFSGIVVGNWQESVSVGVCAGLGIWWLNQFFNRDNTFHSFFDWRRSWAMLGYFIGTATNCLCPATMSRVATVTTPVTDQLLVAAYSVSGILMLLTAIIILGVKGKLRLQLSFGFENGGIPDVFLIMAILFLIIFNAAIGVYSNRQLFGANLFAIILLLRILPKHRFNLFLNLLAGMAVFTTWFVMYVGIKEVDRQYHEITAIYMDSKDGDVEYDRVRIMTLGHPSDAKYYEDILGQFDNDLHHSLMKDFKHRFGGKTLKLKPTANPEAEKIQEYAPGHFYVTVEESKKGMEPREVTVYGHYHVLGGIKIPAGPRQLKLQKFSRKKGAYGTAVIIPEYPMFKTDSLALRPRLKNGGR